MICNHETRFLVRDIRFNQQHRMNTGDPETAALDLAAALPGQVLLLGFDVRVLVTRWRQRQMCPPQEAFTVWDNWFPSGDGVKELQAHLGGAGQLQLLVIAPDCTLPWRLGLNGDTWSYPGVRFREMRAVLRAFEESICPHVAVVWINPPDQNSYCRDVWHIRCWEAIAPARRPN